MLLGLVHPTSGQALVEGARYVALPGPCERRRGGARVGQLPSRSFGAESPTSAGDRRRRARLASRRGTRGGRADRRGSAARRHVLARHAPAAQRGRRAARVAAPARARRARQRARPGGNSLAARLPAFVRGRRRDHADLESRARGGGPDRGRGRDHPPRQAGRSRAARGVDGADGRRHACPLAGCCAVARAAGGGRIEAAAADDDSLRVSAPPARVGEVAAAAGSCCTSCARKGRASRRSSSSSRGRRNDPAGRFRGAQGDHDAAAPVARAAAVWSRAAGDRTARLPGLARVAGRGAEPARHRLDRGGLRADRADRRSRSRRR